jgi:RNA polymerase sigma-70 factor, ECF subfamily
MDISLNPAARPTRRHGPACELTDIVSSAPVTARVLVVPETGAIDYERLRERLSQAVRRTCPRVLAHQRDDLVQNCMLRVMDVIRKSEMGRQFSSSYLHKVAYSALVDEIRRMRRRPQSPLEDGEHVPSAGPDGNPEQVATSRELGRGILDCLGKLLQERRLAVTLHLQGHTIAEAARILSWSTKRTENLVYRGLADLRACLAVKGMKP